MNTLIKPPCCNPRQTTNKAIVNNVERSVKVIESICIFPNTIQSNEAAKKYVLISKTGERMTCSHERLLRLMTEKKLIVNNLSIGRNRHHNIHSKRIEDVIYSGDMMTWDIVSSNAQTELNITAEQLLNDFKQGLGSSNYAKEELAAYGKYNMTLSCEKIDCSRIRKDSLYEELCKDFEAVYNSIDIQKDIFKLQYVRTEWSHALGVTVFIAHIKNSDKLYMFIDDCDIDGACATDYFVVNYKSLRAILQNGEFYATDYACKLGAKIERLF